MAGKPILRPARLAVINTTSLFAERPTQYDRVSIPGEIIGGKKGRLIKYHFIGERTSGVGTFQFGDVTIRSVIDFLQVNSNGRQVKYIFGEGASPKLNALRDGLAKLGFDPKKELQHGHKKPLYGVKLISNPKDYLLQQVKHPKYLFNRKSRKAKTKAIVEWWYDRWVKNRILKPKFLEEVRKHNLLISAKIFRH